MGKFINRILRAGEGRTLKKLEAIKKQVNALEPTFEDMTDEELRGQTEQFKERIADGETLDELLPEAFATVREAARRTIGQRPYDVQIMGGAALHLGNIAEMKTGEGKTLVATLPSYLNALTGKGVHVVTVNDYLASYQSELMGRIHRFLGLTTGCILTGQDSDERRKEYAADITYGTNNEFGFDYLRDNMAWQTSDLVQRGHNFVIVDEVDSILIDEARTPLIISGPAEGDADKWYSEFARLALRMRKDTDYEVDEKKRTVGILEPGIDKVEDLLGIDNLYESLNTPLIGYLNNAIKAKELFVRDKDYIVRDGEVLIVDEHTGRVLPGRRYNEGMHQAIEAKEGVEIKAENQTLATITLQNYFRLYDKLSGMTGTAETEAEEFASTYKLGVVPIPTNMPMIREDKVDYVFPSRKSKLKAIVEDIKERYEVGQPVLVGTTSVEKSEELSKLLRDARVPHQVLNAKQHEREAAVVAEAGRKGSVTVATNMAGRGTDIMLGGNPEHRAVAALKSRGLDPEKTPDEYEAAWPQALKEAEEAVAEEHDEVVELGGLYVLGSERHESRRIDNQLRGRSGRQGDPGESRFYLSLEDDLMRLFATGIAQRALNPSIYPEDEPLEFKIISKSIERAQTSIESRNAEIRKNVLKYDDVMNEQRNVVYAERRRILEGEDLEAMVEGFLDYVVEDIVGVHTQSDAPDEWDLDKAWIELKGFYRPGFTVEELIDEVGGVSKLEREHVLDELKTDIHTNYRDREEEVGEDAMRELERQVILNVLDRKWREHLYEMDYLKEGIGLRAMAQRDPLVEYKSEGYDMFQAMNDGIKEESVRYLFNFELPSEREEREAAIVSAESAAQAAAEAEAAVGFESDEDFSTVSEEAGSGSKDVALTDSAAESDVPAEAVDARDRSGVAAGFGDAGVVGGESDPEARGESDPTRGDASNLGDDRSGASKRENQEEALQADVEADNAGEFGSAAGAEESGTGEDGGREAYAVGEADLDGEKDGLREQAEPYGHAGAEELAGTEEAVGVEGGAVEEIADTEDARAFAGVEGAQESVGGEGAQESVGGEGAQESVGVEGSQEFADVEDRRELSGIQEARDLNGIERTGKSADNEPGEVLEPDETLEPLSALGRIKAFLKNLPDAPDPSEQNGEPGEVLDPAETLEPLSASGYIDVAAIENSGWSAPEGHVQDFGENGIPGEDAEGAEGDGAILDAADAGSEDQAVGFEAAAAETEANAGLLITESEVIESMMGDSAEQPSNADGAPAESSAERVSVVDGALADSAMAGPPSGAGSAEDPEAWERPNELEPPVSFDSAGSFEPDAFDSSDPLESSSAFGGPDALPAGGEGSPREFEGVSFTTGDGGQAVGYEADGSEEGFIPSDAQGGDVDAWPVRGWDEALGFGRESETVVSQEDANASHNIVFAPHVFGAALSAGDTPRHSALERMQTLVLKDSPEADALAEAASEKAEQEAPAETDGDAPAAETDGDAPASGETAPDGAGLTGENPESPGEDEPSDGAPNDAAANEIGAAGDGGAAPAISVPNEADPLGGAGADSVPPASLPASNVGQLPEPGQGQVKRRRGKHSA